MTMSSAMDDLLTQLRAAAEPTRLRLLALCARGAWCVSDLVAILGQSQPRLSRHLKLLVEAGLLVRTPEGANAWFQVCQATSLGNCAGNLQRHTLPSNHQDSRKTTKNKKQKRSLELQ